MLRRVRPVAKEVLLNKSSLPGRWAGPRLVAYVSFSEDVFVEALGKGELVGCDRPCADSNPQPWRLWDSPLPNCPTLPATLPTSSSGKGGLRVLPTVESVRKPRATTDKSVSLPWTRTVH